MRDKMEKMKNDLFRADIYRILAFGFDPPCPKTKGEMEGILKELLEEGVPFFKNRPLRGHLIVLKEAMEKTSADLLENEYNRLFVTQAACPPSEGSYHLAERGPILGDIAGFYRAFRLNFLAHEGPPDAVKMELGFMSYMALKESYALENNLLQEASITKEAQKKFLLEHLGRWGTTFIARLQGATTEDFYASLGNLLKAWLKMENKHFNIEPVPLPIPLPQSP